MKTFADRLTDYIEFAAATRNFSNLSFYKELKSYLQDLESDGGMLLDQVCELKDENAKLRKTLKELDETFFSDRHL